MKATELEPRIAGIAIKNYIIMRILMMYRSKAGTGDLEERVNTKEA